MKVKLDENIGVRGIELLESAGHDVTTVFSQSLTSTGDKKLLEVCRDEGRCLITLDLDFSNPVTFKPAEYAGIAVLRLPSKRGPTDLYTLLSTLIIRLEKSEIYGRLWIVQARQIRNYQPE
ncbi:MAG: DUF5615 family PIN-like protein [Cyanobacteria bacterium]|nr:DUF5615 family PIN-like protein [Cyanobacteriota bacterium]